MPMYYQYVWRSQHDKADVYLALSLKFHVPLQASVSINVYYYLYLMDLNMAVMFVHAKARESRFNLG